MATIASTTTSTATSATTVTRTTMTSSDTFTFTKGAGQKLFLYNTTASPIVITIDGTGGTTLAVPASLGLGGSVSVSSGTTVSVPADGSKLINCDDYSAYLQGTVAITGGTGLIAHLTV